LARGDPPLYKDLLTELMFLPVLPEGLGFGL
jgi:hypothetical protein